MTQTPDAKRATIVEAINKVDKELSLLREKKKEFNDLRADSQIRGVITKRKQLKKLLDRHDREFPPEQ